MLQLCLLFASTPPICSSSPSSTIRGGKHHGWRLKPNEEKGKLPSTLNSLQGSLSVTQGEQWSVRGRESPSLARNMFKYLILTCQWHHRSTPSEHYWMPSIKMQNELFVKPPLNASSFAFTSAQCCLCRGWWHSVLQMWRSILGGLITIWNATRCDPNCV